MDARQRLRNIIYYGVVLVMLVFFMSARVLLITYSRHGQPTYPYIFTTINVVSELAKLAVTGVAYLLERYIMETTSTPLMFGWSKSLNFAVPAVLYAIKDNVSMYILLYVSPAVFELTGQIKTPFTAIMMWLVLQKTFTDVNCFGIVYLFIGASLSQFSCHDKFEVSQFVGVMLIVLVAFLSSLANVYNEWRLTEHKKDSINVQNFHTYIYSSLASLLIFFIYDWKQAAERGVFVGYSVDVVYIVGVTVAAGLLMSVVMKHINNIARICCHAVAIIVITVVDVAFLGYGKEMSFTFAFSIIIVISSIVLYYCGDIFPDLKRRQANDTEDDAASPMIQRQPPHQAIEAIDGKQ